MKPPVALFKKRSMKLYLFLKAESQAKACIINIVVCSFHKRKRRKENCLEKIR